MKLIKCFLNQVAYHYFPKDIHRSDPRFVATEENINYLKINSDWETLIKEILPFVEQLKSSLNIDNLILNGAPIGALAYQIEIPLRYNLDTRKVITIYISLLIPFYHIIKLQDNFNNKIISSYDIPKRIDKVVATLMNKNLGYQKFPKDLLEIGIPRIKLEDNFTHLNAFLRISIVYAIIKDENSYEYKTHNLLYPYDLQLCFRSRFNRQMVSYK